jgi:predicted nucleotidyltransferase
MILQDFADKKLIQPPKWLPTNTAYLAIVGSESYGANMGESSDQDIQGFCVPPKQQVFPHLAGEIPGFGQPLDRFQIWQEHHVKHNGKEFDFGVHSVVKFFHLAMENNPNFVDVLFVPQNCIKHITSVGQMVRDNRHKFLHAGCFAKFRGYASTQMAKLQSGANRSNPKRASDIATHGFDVKFLYHVVRLALECEQILCTGDLDLKRDSQFLLSIRRGEMSLADGQKWWASKARDLETAYANCTAVPREPDIQGIKLLLIKCLERHYGDLSDAVVHETPVDQVLAAMQAVIDTYKR